MLFVPINAVWCCKCIACLLACLIRQMKNTRSIFVSLVQSMYVSACCVCTAQIVKVVFVGSGGAVAAGNAMQLCRLLIFSRKPGMRRSGCLTPVACLLRNRAKFPFFFCWGLYCGCWASQGSPGPLTLIWGIGGGGALLLLSRARRHFRTGMRLSPWDGD